MLAQYEAARRESLTTPYHLPLSFDPDTLALVGTLDGSRSLSQLRNTFGDELVLQTVGLLARWGLLD